MSRIYFKKWLILFFIFFCILFYYNCNMENLIIKYSDGNGNSYIIKNDTIEYNPVKPENSSSGTYDGGEYIKRNITKKEYDSILSVLNKAVKNKRIHIKNRIMMSGMIIIENNNIKNIFIIKPGSNEQTDIENTLKNIIKI